MVGASVAMYEDVTSGILQRGEQLFPFCAYAVKIDLAGLSRAVDVIPLNGDRFMTLKEILDLYE